MSVETTSKPVEIVQEPSADLSQSHKLATRVDLLADEQADLLGGR